MPARAPRPGVSNRAKAQRVALRIFDGDEEHILRMADLGPADSRECRKQTGFPIDTFFNGERFGADGLIAVLWLARRKNGEPGLTFKAVEDKYPTFADLEKFEVSELTEDEGDDPLQ